MVTARSRGEALPAGTAFVAGDVASASGAMAAGALDALGRLDILERGRPKTRVRLRVVGAPLPLQKLVLQKVRPREQMSFD